MYSLPSARRRPAAFKPASVLCVSDLQGIDLGTNKATLKVGVNDTCSLWSGGTNRNSPRTDFFLACGKISA